MYSRLILALFLTLPLVVAAQEGQSLMDKGTSLMQLTPDSARFYLDQAYKAFYKSTDKPSAYKTKYYKGATYFLQQQFQQAYDTLITSLLAMEREKVNDSSVLSMFYNGLGFVLRDLNRFKEAEQYLVQGIKMCEATEDFEMLSKLSSNLGTVYIARGDYMKAEWVYLNQLAKQQLTEENLLSIYGDLGDLYSRFLMQPDKAHIYLDKAIDLITKHYGREHDEYVDRLLNKAAAFFYSGDYHRAIEIWLQAKAIAEKLGDQKIVSFVLNNMGRAYQLQGNLEMAITLTKQSLKIKEKLLGDKNPSTLISYNNLGRLYALVNNIPESNLYLNRSIKLHRELFGDAHPEMARAYAFIGYNYLIEKKYRNGIEKLIEGYSTVAHIEIRNQSLAPPEVIPFNPFDYSSLVLSHALLLHDSIKATSYSETLATYTLECLRKGDVALMNIRHGILPSDAVYQSGIYIDYYKAAIEIVYDFFEQTGQDKYFDDYLFFSDRQKGFNLLVATNERERPVELLPEAISKKEQILKQQLADQLRSVKNGASSESLFTKQVAYNLLLEDIAKNYPAYNSWKFGTVPVSLNDVQSHLENGLVLDYITTDSALFITAITRSDRRIIKIPIQKTKLDAEVDAFRAAINKQNLNEIDRSGYQLYKWLIQPVEVALKQHNFPWRAIVVPDGLLTHIPFEALVKRPDAGPSDKFLISDYIFSMQYNLSLAFRNQQEKSTGELYAFAPVYDKNSASMVRNGLAELPFAQQEAVTVASMLRGEVINGNTASVATFKSLAKKASVIHIASHVMVNEFNPDASSIIFSTIPDNDELDELTAFDLYAMNLQADLVTLSGCNSGVGKIERGEGAMSLARAFIYAGCSNIVMSLWQVADESTNELMAFFYTNLKNGKNKDEALRDAKLSFLRNADEVKANPYYWSAFVYSGNQLPLQVSYLNWWKYAKLIVSITIGLILIGLILKWRLKASREH